MLRLPPLIYCIANGGQVATFAAKQRTPWWRSSTSNKLSMYLVEIIISYQVHKGTVEI